MRSKFTKIFALGMSAVISITMLAGCGSQKNDTATASTQSGTEQVSSKYDPLSLRYFYFWENKGTIDQSKDMVAPVLEKKFNVSFSEIINPTKDPGDKFKLMINTGDIPDVMFVPFSELSGVNNFGTQGLFLDLTQSIDKYPNLKKLYTPYIKRTLTAKDNKIYTLAQNNWETAKDPNYNKEGMWIKKSILEKLGIKQTDFKTPEDLYNICMRIKNEIKEYNGQPIIPYGLGAEGWGDSKFFLMFGADWHNLMPDDKSITFLPTDPGAKQGLNLIYKMMKNGLIEKDAFIQKDAQWREKLAQGRYAMIMHAPSIVVNDLQTVFQQSNPNDEYVPVSFPWETQLHKYFNYPSNPEGITLFSSKIKNPDQVLAMCDWIASDEGYMTVTSGTEGKLYTMSDGKAVLTDDGIKAKNDGKLLDSLGLNNWYALAGFGDTWKKVGGISADDPNIKEASDIIATYKEKDDGTSLYPNPDSTVAPQVAFRNDGWGILFKIWKDAQAKSIYAKTEEEAMATWDRAVLDMQKQAGDKMSKEFEAEYQKQLELLKNDTVAQEEAKKVAATLK